MCQRTPLSTVACHWHAFYCPRPLSPICPSLDHPSTFFRWEVPSGKLSWRQLEPQELSKTVHNEAAHHSLSLLLPTGDAWQLSCLWIKLIAKISKQLIPGIGARSLSPATLPLSLKMLCTVPLALPPLHLPVQCGALVHSVPWCSSQGRAGESSPFLPQP